MAVNRDETPHIVISASGMCEGGRILHHLRHKIHNRKNTILIVGYMAQHTLGRRILEQGLAYEEAGRKGAPPMLKFFGKVYPLKAAHPDWIIRTWWWQGMWNLTVPGAREHKVRVLRELAENYDLCDGGNRSERSFRSGTRRHFEAKGQLLPVTVAQDSAKMAANGVPRHRL